MDRSWKPLPSYDYKYELIVNLLSEYTIIDRKHKIESVVLEECNKYDEYVARACQ